jgi:hypothetical protein
MFKILSQIKSVIIISSRVCQPQNIRLLTGEDEKGKLQGSRDEKIACTQHMRDGNKTGV